MLMCLQYLYVSCLTFKIRNAILWYGPKVIPKNDFGMTFPKVIPKNDFRERRHAGNNVALFLSFVFSVSSNILQFFKIECIVTGIWDTSWSVYISPGKHKQDSLSVWLVDLVADWQEKTSSRQTGRLTDWLPGWLVETLSNWLVVCLIEWLSDRLVDWELKDGPLQKQKWVWCVYTHTSIMIRYCPCPLPP